MQLAALGAFAPEPAMKVCSSRSTLLSEIAPSYVPGFPPLLQDADNCTLVVIFPRSRRDGGEVDGSTMVDMPFTKAQKIFRTHCPSSDATLQRLEHIASDDESISMEMFQQDIRSRFVEILSDSGLHSSQFASIDRDEDFLKIWLPLDGPVIEYMAEVLKYSMPLRESVYETIEAREPFPGGKRQNIGVRGVPLCFSALPLLPGGRLWESRCREISQKVELREPEIGRDCLGFLDVTERCSSLAAEDLHVKRTRATSSKSVF